MGERYDVPAVVGRRWVERRRVILLLDGLDEVAPHYQAACVDAINMFRKQYGFAGLAVGCRTSDYHMIKRQVRLRAAIRLHLLTPQHIDRYLARLGTEFADLRNALARDSAMRHLAQTPLLLSMMIVVYRGWDALDILKLRGAPNRRTILFDRFIEHAFASFTGTGVSPTAKVHRYLSWLALRMRCFNMTVINEHTLAFGEEKHYFREKPRSGLFKYGLSPYSLWNGLAYVTPGGARLRRSLNILMDNEPWDVHLLLDQATDLGLMRPVHNGYIFIHRLLLEHLAETAPPDLEESMYKKAYRLLKNDRAQSAYD